METFEHDSNCHSSQPFSLYDHYMRSFHRTEHYFQRQDSVESPNYMYEAGESSNSSNALNIDNTSNGDTDVKQNVFEANKCSTKTRTSIRLHIGDDEPLLQCEVQNFKVSALSVSRALEPESVDENLESNKSDCLIHDESAYPMRECFSSDCSTVCQANDIGLPQTVYSTPALCDSLSDTNGTTHQLQSNINRPELPTSSDDTRSDQSVLSNSKPVLTTSLITMENSNNAVDSARLFDNAQSEEETSNNIFKLPYNELSFNGTLKQLQKLKPIVDPSSALCADNVRISNDIAKMETDDNILEKLSSGKIGKSSFISSETVTAESNSALSNSNDTHYKDRQLEKCGYASSFSSVTNADSMSRQHSESSFNKSSESADHSFNSGINSPNMFSDDDEECDIQNHSSKSTYELALAVEKHETCDKFRVKKMEKTLQGVLPPPSVTTFNLDVADMLKRYKDFLPLFNGESKPAVGTCLASCTPPRELRIGSYDSLMASSLANALENTTSSDSSLQLTRQEKHSIKTVSFGNEDKIIKQESTENKLNGSLNSTIDDISRLNAHFALGTEEDARQLTWPNIVKCRYFGLHYNVSSYAERAESLAMKCAERYVSQETASSCTIFSGSLMSPSSAQKRKVIRAKMASAKSPGRRLSHLARRRQTFCSAATLAENAHASASKMVLIDKNFFPHRKLTSFHANRKSPRGKQTPGKRTPSRKTPGKKTPGRKTPGSSANKRGVRRLLIDSDVCTRSQPTRETSKRALFLSPENSKVPQQNSQSAPRPSGSRPFKSKRALFSSPEKGSNVGGGNSNSSTYIDINSDDSVCGKRKYESTDFTPGQRCKMQKSLSFGGDNIQDSGRTGAALSRRATECFSSKKADLNELHKKKLLWAVAEALRAHGCTLGDDSFRTRATALARLTRRLLTLPPHAATLADSRASTSETMLKLARQYVFSIIRGRSVEELLLEEQMRLAARGPSKLTGYVSLRAYHEQRTSTESRENHNTLGRAAGKCEPKSATKNVLQDKVVNVNSKSQQFAATMSDKSVLFKSNSMPSTRDNAKRRACRQISFDNMDEATQR